MPYDATVKFVYVNQTEPHYNKHFPEIVDQQTITIEAPAQDLNVHQYFEMFKGFLRAVGFDDYNIMDGACRLAFNDGNEESKMQKLMQEYDLQDKQIYTDKEYFDLKEKVEKLEQQLVIEEDTSNKDMWDQGMLKVTTNNPIKAWNGLIPGSPEAREKGCICPVLDNQEMPDDRKWIDVECPIHGRSK